MKRNKTQAAPRALAAVKPAIDYPREGESIAGAYTVRLSAPGALAVHVAVNQGVWLECREALGYWWFDWIPEGAGEHELLACAAFADGREAVSETVHCVRT